jgi:hypothetical protein
VVVDIEAHQIRHLLAFDIDEAHDLAFLHDKRVIALRRDNPFLHDRAGNGKFAHHWIYV